MPFFHDQERSDLRRHYVEAWRKHRAGTPLEPLEHQLVTVIEQHAEYHALLESGPDALGRDYTPESGQSNPFLHLGLHLAIREQVAGAVDLIVHLHRLRDGTRRVTHITEVLGMEGEVITTQDIFLFDYGMGVDEDGYYRGYLKSTGLRPSFSKKLEDAGIRMQAEMFAPEGFAREADTFDLG